MAIQRTDAHRVGAIMPPNYTYLFHFSCYIPQGHRVAAEVDRYNMDKLGALGMERWQNPRGVSNSNCDTCGAAFHHGAAFRHIPTGDVIIMGHDCVDKYAIQFSRGEHAAWKRWHAERAKAHAAATKGARFATARWELLQREPEFAAALEYLVSQGDNFGRSVDDQLTRKGSATQPQIDGIVRAAQRVRKFQAKKVEWAERDAAIDWITAPVGKRTVAGEVLMNESRESRYGVALKMLIRVDTPEGSFKLWSTVPKGIIDSAKSRGINAWDKNSLRGACFEITANLSRGDETGFGFTNRPTGTILSLPTGTVSEAPTREALAPEGIETYTGDET